LLVLLSFPLVFACLIGLSFGSRGDRVPRVRLLVENQDGGIAGNALLSALTAEQMAEYVETEVVGAEGAGRIENGDASALQRIPWVCPQDTLGGNPARLPRLRNPAQGILPEIAEQIIRVLVDVLDAGSRVLREPLREISAGTGGRGLSDEAVVRVSLAVKRSL